MEPSTARRLAHAVQRTDLDPATQSLLFAAISAAVRYDAMMDVLFDTDVRDGNRALINELWAVSTYDVRADLVAPEAGARQGEGK